MIETKRTNTIWISKPITTNQRYEYLEKKKKAEKFYESMKDGKTFILENINKKIFDELGEP